MRGLRGKAICRGLRNAAALVIFAGALAAGEAAEAPRFLKAKPVWPKDRQTERNTFFGFRACVDAPAATAAVLRVTGCSDYRVSLNGDFLAYGPARAAKGFFRVDEIALSLAR